MTKEDLYRQNLSDLLRIATIMGEILNNKYLTDEEDKRIGYCTKVMKDVNGKLRLINKNFKS